ncbi:MAG: gluconate 2-dehydrogenase subunit 3 family protein [Saprospiraceae bacterium]|nr:MAG: gluconate 2-dehydrogenase subunit 3 family protein [Saprospiraceae bacterium]
MNRRDSIKFIGVGSISAGMILGSCKPDGKNVETATEETPEVLKAGRQKFEIERDNKLLSETFFDDHEMATITVLADIIIPADEKSGSATEAEVPAFIEFIVKDMPYHQVPMRGGLRWLDMECLKRFEKTFVDCSKKQQLEVVEDIAYPNDVKPGLEQGAAFFSRMRDLTATGFFTTQMGIEDLGYMGNRPGTYDGPPEDEIAKHGLEDVL